MKIARISVLLSGLVAMIGLGIKQMGLEARNIKRKSTIDHNDASTKADELAKSVDADIFQKNNPLLVATSHDR